MGHRCNAQKLLLDPYAKAIADQVIWNDDLFGDDRGFSRYRPSPADSARHTMRSVVIDSHFDWADDQPPRIPYHETLIYKAHVKGMTKRHPTIPKELCGKYGGLAQPEIIDHLHYLGVTAVALLPVQQFISERDLVERGLANYWGFNPIGLFAPHNGYASGPNPVDEFKSMVKTLHKAGIEVILDVVYPHTAEFDERGPTLSFRGIDNAGYYSLIKNDPR